LFIPNILIGEYPYHSRDMLSSQYKIQQNMTTGSAGIQIFEDINTSADQSVRFGEGAGKLSYGTGNAFMGYQSGEQNLGGSYVTFIGYQAGQFNQSSSSTTLVGAFAGRQNTNGNETVFVGFRAGEFNLNGDQNVGVGAFSLRENNSGSGTTAVGWAAAERNLDGDYNTMVGAEAGQNNRSGNYNTMAGYRVGRATFAANENTFFGAYAGYSNEYGSDNCLIGFKAGLDVINGNFNIAIGAYSLSSGRINSNIASDCNVVIGAFTNTSGSGNVILGLNAGSNSSGDDNVFIGKDVALVYDGHKSVIIGSRALIEGSGECNTMLGYGIAPNFVNGSNNVLIGVGADTYGSNTSYTIAIGTSNVRTFTHSISIGDALDNKRQETISIGFDINTIADNSVIIGKSLNINNARVFKDPISYPYISLIDAKADQIFGPTNVGYSYLLISPSNTIYTVGGAGQFTSNIISSRGNRRTTNVSQSSNYDLITGNGQFDKSLIHHGSVLFLNTYDDVLSSVSTYSLIKYYNNYGNIQITSNISTIGSANSLYSNQIDITLTYQGVSNVVTNLTQFNTSNTTYGVYLQKQVQVPSCQYSISGSNQDTVQLINGPLDGTISFGSTPVVTTFVGDGISPFNIDSANTQVKYVISEIPQYGMLNNYIYNNSCSNSILTNSCNLTSNIVYTPFHEYAYGYSNSSFGDNFSIKSFLQISETNSNVYGSTSVDIEEKQFYIERPTYASNVIIRNSIVFNSDDTIHTFRFSSNDFIGVPNGLNVSNHIIIDDYDTVNFDLYTPYYPDATYFTYSNLINDQCYLTQKTSTLSSVVYDPIIGFIIDNRGTSNAFTMSMSSIPTNMINITPSYTIPLSYTSSTVASDTYTLPNVILNDVWAIKGSSNADIQIPSTITNLNQCTYRRINPFVKTDTIKIVGKSNSYLQEIDISYSNANSFIYNTIKQAAITCNPITTYTSNYVYTSCNIQSLPILNTSNLFTSNFTSNIETGITTFNSSFYNPFTFALSGSYNSDYGYSNIWGYYSISNIYPINSQVVTPGSGEITIISTIFTSNLVYSIDGNLLGTPEYTSNLLSSRSISNIEDLTVSYTSNIINNYSNTILLTQASNYLFSNIQQQQHSFYNYGLINTYQNLLLYTSNTTSNVSAKTIAGSQIPISSNAVLSGINNYINTTSNILEFVEHQNSNAVLPITRAMMFKEGGNFTFKTKNGFDVVLSNQGPITSSWTQAQIDNGSLYLQMPTASPSIDRGFTITETTTSTDFTNTISLYNSNIVNSSPVATYAYNLTYADRYTSDGKTVHGIYNLNGLANYLKNNLNIDGFTASDFYNVYLNKDVDYILLDSDLKQSYVAPISGDSYIMRTNRNHSNIELYMFAKNSSGETITNIIKVPVAVDEIPPSGIPRQGFNYGISVGNKNMLNPEIFTHSWSNLHSSNLRIQIKNTLSSFDFKLTSNNQTLTDASVATKRFTQQDCLTGKIFVEPLVAETSGVLTYDLVNVTDDITPLFSDLTYNLASYEYYAFPTNNEVGSNSYLTTLLYGSNQSANVFSDVLSSAIGTFTNAGNASVPLSNVFMYIEKAPSRGVIYDSVHSNMPYQITLDKKLRYLSYTPDDIQHDTIDIRIGYRTSNISPRYSISLSNYALPFANMALEAGRHSSNYPVSSLAISSKSNIDRYLSDSNTFSSNYLPIPVSSKIPLNTYNYPITLYGKSGSVLATTVVQIQPYALSTKPDLSDTSVSINAAQYSQTSLRSLLDIVKTDYKWNSAIDFVLTIPIVEGSNSMTSNGVIMKKSYNEGQLILTPVSHFTNDDLEQDLVVYQHIGSNYGTPSLSDTFTCYATNGPYSYNSNIITANITITPLPYVKTISDDYVYYNTKLQAAIGFNALKNVFTVGTTSTTLGTDDVSFSVVQTSNVDIIDIGNNSNITNIFSVADLENGTIGYKIQQSFLDANVYTNLWPFSITLSPNGLPSSTNSNELVSLPQYRSIFAFDARGSLNIYESSNTVLYEQTSNQNLTYTFASSDTFVGNPLDIMFQVKPAQSISTSGMSGFEFIDSSNLRTFKFGIQLGNTPEGSNIFDAMITESGITINEPQYKYRAFDNTILFDDWNNIIISTVDRDNTEKASIAINSLVIFIDTVIDVNQLKYIAITTNETDTSNFTSNIMLVNNPNPLGELPLSYYITNYATTLYLRNFEIDIFTPYNTITDYDPFTNNVIIGKDITVKGTDNIAVGKQFSTSGQNNIILGNYIGVDKTNLVGTNDIFESIIIGNNSFINGAIRDIIAIGNSNLNDLSGIDPVKLNDFVSQRPIIIGNAITSRYIDYHVNIANTFLKTNVINSQVYVGLNNEKVAIGYDTNEGFSAYQDLYVKHGIYVGTSAPSGSNQYAVDIMGDVNITGNTYIGGNVMAASNTLTASNITASDTLTASNINFLGGLFENGLPYVGSQWTTSGSNIYYTGGSVGVGHTPDDIYSIDVLGNINFTGNLYQNGVLYPLGGNGYGDGSNASNIWVHSSNTTGVLVPGSGIVSYSSSSNSIFRHSDNNVDYGFDFSFTITSGSGGIGDYKLMVPFEVDTSYYLNNSVIGNTQGLIINGSLSNYFPISVRSPIGNNQSNVIVRFMNGTTETSLATLSSGTTVQLSGMFNYVSTSILPTISVGGGGGGTTWLNVVGGIYNSNLANVGIGTTRPRYNLDVVGNINFTSNIYQRDTLIDLTSISIIGSNLTKFNPWINTSNSPQITLPSPGTVSYSSSSNSIYRHIDNDVEYAFNMTATITQTSGVGDYTLSVPIPINLNYYTSNVIIGNIWSRVTSGSLVNYLPVSVSTLGGTQSNAVAVRFVNGTTETPMSILTTGNVLQLSGTVEYVSSIYPRSGIFLSNVCYQDDYGHVGFNTFGPLRAQVDIVGDNKYTIPALYVEQVSPNSYGLYVSGDTNITGSITSGCNIYASNATIYNGLVINTINASSATISGTLITSNLNVLGSNTILNTYTISTSNVSVSNISGTGPALSVSQKGVGAGYPIADFYDVDVSTDIPVFRIADGGNIGIGTTNPKEKLDVNGNMSITGNIVPSQCNVFDIGSSNYRFRDIYLSGNTIDLDGTLLKRDAITGGLKIISGSGSLLDTSVRNLYTSSNVGIGTTITRQQLDVFGTAIISSSLGIGTTVSVNALDVLGAMAIGSTYMGTVAPTNGIIVSGNVGIGTSNPQYVLHVNGTIKSSGLVFSDGTTQNTATGGWSTPETVTIATTGGASTIGTTKNVIKYRTIGGVTEVFMAIVGDGTETSTVGQYVYTLPGGKTFDLTQFPTYTVLTTAPTGAQWLTAGASMIPVNGSFEESAAAPVRIYVVPYTSTQFRIFVLNTLGGVYRIQNTVHWSWNTAKTLAMQFIIN